MSLSGRKSGVKMETSVDIFGGGCTPLAGFGVSATKGGAISQLKNSHISP